MKKTNRENRLPAKNNPTINTKVWKAPILTILDVKQTLLGSPTGINTGECDPTITKCPN